MNIDLGKRSMFYRSSNRKLPGLNWRNNTRIPDRLRFCDHSILVSEDVVKKIKGSEGYINVEIFYNDVFKGSYRILLSKVLWWRDTIGYYTSSAGNKHLALPVALWEVIKEPAKPKECQLKLI